MNEKMDKKEPRTGSPSGSTRGAEHVYHVYRLVDTPLTKPIWISIIMLIVFCVEALGALKKNPTVNLVLTDMWMPVMDGEGLIGEIRSREQWKDLPVYAVTADIETQKTYRDSGFTGILLKPITLDRLQSVVS